MGAPEEILELARKGLSPGQIRQARAAEGKGSSVNTIIPYFDGLIGRGSLTRSDVVFLIPDAARQGILERLVSTPELNDREIVSKVEEDDISVDEADVAALRRYGDARFSYGDMYEDLRNIEIALHSKLQRALEQRFGSDWWPRVVPKTVRHTCERWRCQDTDPVLRCKPSGRARCTEDGRHHAHGESSWEGGVPFRRIS